MNDNEELAENLRLLLEHSGYESFAATDTESGLEIVQGQKIDLIIQDIKRPGRDGWTFYRLLKSDSSLSDIPIVILSAASKQSQEYVAPQLNEIAAYLQAPCDFDEILKAVKTCLVRSDDRTAY